MGHISSFLTRTDTIGALVAVVLLTASVVAWVIIFWKFRVLRRASVDIGRAIPAFWDASSVAEGRARLAAMDREGVLQPLVDAAWAEAPPHTLQAQAQMSSQLTRRLRTALQRGLAHLQFGQVVLATTGSTAPFIGLLGTVWGIYHALVAVGESASFTLDKVAGPVGEALIMTAAGLAVAIPAVLAYNLFGRWVAAAEAELEGFAEDLRDFVLETGHGSRTSERSARSEAAGGA
jgi:biopolymer transport protein ExbB